MSDIQTIGEPKDLATLYGKIARVTAAMQRVPKNGVNKHQGYKYATESDIVDTLRTAMAEEKIAIIPSVESTERIPHPNERLGPITRLFMRFVVACGDTGAMIILPWIGDGQDTADKGVYKAYTGAEKYFLMKLFLVATGDDPEQDNEAQQHQPIRQPARQEAPRTPSPRNEHAELADKLRAVRQELTRIGGTVPMLTSSQVAQMSTDQLSSMIAQTRAALEEEQTRLTDEAQQRELVEG